MSYRLVRLRGELLMPPALAEIDWNTLLQRSSEEFPLLVFFALMALIAITAIIAVQWRKTHEVRLKMRMIERGFSPDDIVRILNARPGRRETPPAYEAPGCCGS